MFKILSKYKFDGGIVIFLILTGIIVVGGPGHNEGGFKALEDKGAKQALSDAWSERDASTLVGNYGNK